MQQLLERYVRAWQLADIDGFVRLVAEDVRFSMPPLTAWFDGREAVAAFIENAIFAPARPHGVRLQAGSCNGQPAFATYEPDGHGRLAVSGLQVLQLGDVDGQPLITAAGVLPRPRPRDPLRPAARAYVTAARPHSGSCLCGVDAYPPGALRSMLKMFTSGTGSSVKPTWR